MNLFQNPYMNPYAYQPSQPQPKQVEKVNGRNGAMQYPIGPNSSAWILDENGVISWLIITDSAGYRTVTPYDVAPHQDEPPPDFGGLEDRIKRLEEMVSANAADIATVRKEQHAPAGAARTANDEHGPIRTEPHAYVEPARITQPAVAAGNANRPAVRGRPNEGVTVDG